MAGIGYQNNWYHLYGQIRTDAQCGTYFWTFQKLYENDICIILRKNEQCNLLKKPVDGQQAILRIAEKPGDVQHLLRLIKAAANIPPDACFPEEEKIKRTLKGISGLEAASYAFVLEDKMRRLTWKEKFAIGCQTFYEQALRVNWAVHIRGATNLITFEKMFLNKGKKSEEWLNAEARRMFKTIAALIRLVPEATKATFLPRPQQRQLDYPMLLGSDVRDIHPARRISLYKMRKELDRLRGDWITNPNVQLIAIFCMMQPSVFDEDDMRARMEFSRAWLGRTLTYRYAVTSQAEIYDRSLNVFVAAVAPAVAYTIGSYSITLEIDNNARLLFTQRSHYYGMDFADVFRRCMQSGTIEPGPITRITIRNRLSFSLSVDYQWKVCDGKDRCQTSCKCEMSADCIITGIRTDGPLPNQLQVRVQSLQVNVIDIDQPTKCMATQCTDLTDALNLISADWHIRSGPGRVIPYGYTTIAQPIDPYNGPTGDAAVLQAVQAHCKAQSQQLLFDTRLRCIWHAYKHIDCPYKGQKISEANIYEIARQHIIDAPKGRLTLSQWNGFKMEIEHGNIKTCIFFRNRVHHEWEAVLTTIFATS